MTARLDLGALVRERVGAIARETKASLLDAHAVWTALGLIAGPATWRRQPRGGIGRCPAHDDRHPSCSVQERDGCLLWRCHACQAGGDVVDAYAAVHGLSAKRDLREILGGLTATCGLRHLAADLEAIEAAFADLEAVLTNGGAPQETRSRAAASRARSSAREPDRVYPPAAEVAAVWEACVPPSADEETSAMLRGRGFNVDRVDGSEVARVILPTATLPQWALSRGGPWTATGHRLVLGAFDAAGELRSVRAWRVVANDTPKRLPPVGHRASGLVLACPLAVAMLRGTWRPERVLVLEGEPDFLGWACATGVAAYARLGVISGAWSAEIAARIPDGAEVIIRTHADAAGDGYAAEIAATLAGRCQVLRVATRGDDVTLNDDAELLRRGLPLGDPADGAVPFAAGEAMSEAVACFARRGDA
jgi:hypothetical protein